MMRKALLILLLGASLFAHSGAGQDQPSYPDLSQQPTLFVVGYAHLDTQWRWEYPQTIGEYLPKTLHDNFALFEKYPHYIFNFSGANRYRMMKEYYPADFETLRRWVRAGRWFPSGASMEETDVNSPAAESTLRNILYGNQFFRREFGIASAEFMLPDSFGFPSSLPTLLAHAGLRGFSTQKLTWGSATGIPFNVGLWEGPDGSTIVAAFNPGDYVGDITYDLSRSDPARTDRQYVDWPKRIRRNGETGGIFTDFHYYGVGDTGGAPEEASVKLLGEIVSRNDGEIRIVSATAEQMFLAIRPEQTSRLPRYKGELMLTNHSAGSITSQAAHKRWNRKNELLADAAERASVAAAWLGGRPYPIDRLNAAWALVIGGQFHDNAAGTSTPKAYEYTWNDDAIAMNQFTTVLESAAESIASALDTTVKGTPVVIYNPLNIDREDVVETDLSFGGAAPRAIRVFGPNGKEVPSQFAEDGRVLFLARVPSIGFAVYDVRAAETASTSSSLRISESALENERYRVQLDSEGDVASIFDKRLGREILAAPHRLLFQTEEPHDWPAWNMDWDDRQKPPRAYVKGPARVRILERGAARVALEVTRDSEGSTFIQRIRLSAGDAGDRVEIDNAIDWKTPASSLKASFPLAASNAEATYNWGVGTIRRGNNDEKKFEVASHQWIDLTDRGGAHGATILTEHKYGSDKPDDNTIRLTLLYTPGLGAGNGRAFIDQTSQDFGHHRFMYGLTSHGSDYRRDQTDWQALRLEQPLIAFPATKHAGVLGKSVSLLRANSSRVRVMALKRAEESDEIIVRFVEMDGAKLDDLRLSFAGAVRAAREVDGQERRLRDAKVEKGILKTSLSPYQIRSFAVRLAPPPRTVSPPRWQPVALPRDRRVASRDGETIREGFDDSRAMPTELLPNEIAYNGIRFTVGQEALVPRGQTIDLPSGFTRLYVLAASAGGDQSATFRIGNRAVDWNVQAWSGAIGQWDNRVWVKRVEDVPPRPDAPPGAPSYRREITAFGGLAPAFIKPAPLAWYASHHHDAEGKNQAYEYSYLFAYEATIPNGAMKLTLPNNDEIRILAVTVSDEGAPWDRGRPTPAGTRAAGPLPTDASRKGARAARGPAGAGRPRSFFE